MKVDTLCREDIDLSHYNVNNCWRGRKDVARLLKVVFVFGFTSKLQDVTS